MIIENNGVVCKIEVSGRKCFKVFQIFNKSNKLNVIEKKGLF